MTKAVQSGGTVVIAADRCKGCELCIPACPPRVLSMSSEKNALGYYFPILADGCTGCTACHLVCPDFVFEVYRLIPPDANRKPVHRTGCSARSSSRCGLGFAWITLPLYK